MNVTAGFHMDRSGKYYSSVVYHNERKRRKFADKNIYINWKLTPYNQIGKLNDANKLLEDNAESYVKQYNQRQIKEGHKKRCFSSVHQYIQKRSKKAKRRGIVWLGKSKFRTKFENHAVNILKESNPGWSKQRLKLYIRTQFEPKILKRELVGFNKRHQHIKICRYAIHVDEGFIHAHVELVALPSYTKTKIPRPSFSMSKAVREEFPNAVHRYHTKTKYYGKYKRKKKIIHGNFIQHDGKKALHLLDDEEGKAITHIAHDMSRRVGVKDLSLTRTGNASSLSGAKYKHYAKMSDMAKNEEIKASKATSKAKSASVAQSQIIHGLNSTFASASSSVKSNSISASYSLSSAVQSLNTANIKWQSYIETSLSNSVRNQKSSNVNSINSHLIAIYNKQSSSQHSLSAWDSNLASSANDISSGSSSVSAASLSNANYSYELDKREKRIQRNKNAHDDLLTHNIMLAMPQFNDMSKPMQRSTALAFDNNGKLNFNKVKKMFVTGYYLKSGAFQPPYGIATGHSVVKGTAMLVYLYGYDAQHAINTANLQSVLNNTEDYEKNTNKTRYKSNNNDLQL